MKAKSHIAILFTLVLAITGCDSDEASPEIGVDVQAEDVVSEEIESDGEEESSICERPLGAGCLEDAHCSSGVCLVSEFAPFGICTVPCSNPGDFCMGTDGTAHAGFWCVEPPVEEFKKLNHQDTTAFCLKICENLDECGALDPAYETCEEVVYKGNPLYPSSPMPVCQAPSAMGKVPVDPFTCANWKATNPGNSNEKLLCSNYCSYLKSCQYYTPSESLECCEWYCYGRLVKVGSIDGEYEDILRNFTEWFTSFAGTGKQCEAKEEFGNPPIPDEAKPEPDSFLCEDGS